ncbi:MAG: chromosomal replication initiator protein DnaA [Corynebacterium nuruki]|nr:chromosomal replication initiator protein DnaA [Corynebacterium nuruki]
MTTAADFPETWTSLVSRWVTADEDSAEFPQIDGRLKGLLKQLTPITLVSGIAVITAPSNWARSEIEKKLSELITEVLSQELGISVSLSLSVQESSASTSEHASEPVPEPVPEPAADPAPDREPAQDTRHKPAAAAAPAAPATTAAPSAVAAPDPFWEPLPDSSFPEPEDFPGVPAADSAGAPAIPAEPTVPAAPDPTPQPAPRPAPTRTSADSASRQDDEDIPLNPKYTFDTFVIGSSNHFAYAACRAVAEKPGRSYNPLFIYGPPGLGKTHLLHAIGHYARELNPGIKVRYLSSEQLTNQFINALQAGNQAMDAFKRKYRNLDMLIVDDVQFLQGKQSTQEEFFHTFNALYQANHQVVLSSDRPPRQLTTLEERLRTRFEGGLTTDIQTPDLETRMAILAKKADINGTTVPHDVLEYLASQEQTSVRELEGALTRVIAYCSMTHEPITVQSAEAVISEIVPQDVEITPQIIIEVVTDYCGVTVDELVGKGKVRKIASARQYAMYLCRELTDLSLPKIGEAFGGRDHSTVLHAERKIRGAIQTDHKAFQQIQDLTQQIKTTARQG